MISESDVWELRWIAPHLPALPETWVASTLRDPAFSIVEDHDVYLVTGSDRINLKIRRRDNSFKLKRLYERTDDGFERWRTEFDAPLPVGVQLSLGVLGLIGKTGPAERLGAAETAGEALAILKTICDPGQMVAVHKSRRSFQRGNCSLDEVRFRTEDGSYYRSLGVESGRLSELRTVVQELPRGRLGSPRNYMEFLVSRQAGRAMRHYRRSDDDTRQSDRTPPMSK